MSYIHPDDAQVSLRLIRLIASCVGYFVIAGMFANALINPEDNVNFITLGALLVFLSEFFTFHGISLVRSRYSRLYRLGLLMAAYLVMCLAASAFINSAYPVIIFAISMVSKLLFTTGEKTKSYVIFSGFAMSLSLLASLALGNVLVRLFPMPEIVKQASLPMASGDFIDRPQTLLMWGILYFLLQIGYEVIYIAKRYSSYKEG